jgi:pimeloyl-ACP methyl ester carboxylesterase
MRRTNQRSAMYPAIAAFAIARPRCRFQMTTSVSDHWITLEKGKLFARRWTPSRPLRERDGTILLIHDSLGSVELWRDFPKLLVAATGRCVAAYDRLGFGRSDAQEDLLQPGFIHAEAETVIPQLCEALGLEFIIPFGHSVGGAMAVCTAARWPERCRALISESAQSFVEDATHVGLRDAQEKFAQPGQMDRLARYHGTKARWVFDSWIKNWLSACFEEWRLDEELRAMRCPSLVLQGDQDEYGTLEHARRIARLATGPSHLVIIEGCGHVPHREQPKRILDEVTSFLAAVN